ncbi:S9 family peptidase [Kineococcus rubinsiae]|uniref:S9 family peptidase n=1 Tax=Kineococcus rubinsiae TaxID=2609562 RepID=UPI0014317227|nr:alpha/beta fold hydrolase [Kineococcus rubinsiae]NIZ91664.1 S9 family peptidase [Kineococcus rubinsiae]
MASSSAPVPASPAVPFADLDAFAALPRLSGLTLSADGTRLVTSVATLSPDATRWVGALWEVDPAGEASARRLTRSAKGESSPCFAPDGTLLFTSARPDPAASAADGDAPAALWALPPGGEAAVLGTRPGGVSGVLTARTGGRVVVQSPTMPGADATEEGPTSDAARRAARKDRKVSAILHEGYPVRYWDSDLGPDEDRWLAATLPAQAPLAGEQPALTWTDLTPAPGRSLHEGSAALSPDGSLLVHTEKVFTAHGDQRDRLVVVRVEDGVRRVLADDPAADLFTPQVSPDGRWVAALRESRSSPTQPPTVRLVVVALDDGPADAAPGDLRVVVPDWEVWGASPQWGPDSRTLFLAVDHEGGAPVFRVDVASGAVQRLTGDRGAYSDVQVSPGGESVYAVRSAVDAPPAVVRLAASGADQRPVPLRGPAAVPELPGTLDEVTTTAADGSPLRAWLAVPHGAGPEAPAPLLLWIHGGPLGSWNAWSWRWNPWLAVARGYAVLLPDSGLSTGYGAEFLARGWGAWGAEPYTDLLTVTDAALERDDLDAGRTAAMGGSFGGYMANWVAGHTDRFRAIVTHASLWALDQFGPTTDGAYYWTREMTPEMQAANDPAAHAADIVTPMLVIHGDKDYRVPIGEGLRLWWALNSAWEGDPADLPHKFLYYPDENHWVLTPQHAILWYETVFAFLATHVHGVEFQVPDLLR